MLYYNCNILFISKTNLHGNEQSITHTTEPKNIPTLRKQTNKQTKTGKILTEVLFKDVHTHDKIIMADFPCG